MLEAIPESEINIERSSVVDSTLTFNESEWVISVLNTREKEFGGHAILLVEGIKDDQLFVGRYDVFAAEDETSASKSSFFPTINKKGYIANVRAEETSSYDRIACYLVLTTSATKTIPTDISKNEVVLQQVQNDVTAYWLDGSQIRQASLEMSEIEQQDNLQFPELEIERYLIRPTDNEPLVKEVTALCGYQHPDGATFYSQCQSRSFKCPVEDVERMIQSIKTDKTRTEHAHLGNAQYIRYQYLGSENAHGLLKLFSETGCGINCAEWCLNKLKVANVDLKVKPTPDRIAGGPCVIL